MIFLVAPGTMLEAFGDELILANTSNGRLVRFKADGVDVSHEATTSLEFSRPDEELIGELLSSGMITPARQENGLQMSRRSILAGGASAALIGFAVSTLPAAASASSFPVRAGIWERDGGQTAEFIVNETDFPEIDKLEPDLNWEDNTDWALSVPGLVSVGPYDYFEGTFSWMMDFLTPQNLTDAENAGTTFTGTLTSPSAGLSFTVVFTYRP